MESCKADVQRLSLMITQALRNITACLRHEKEQKGGSAKLRQESTAGLLGSAFQVSLYYNLVLLQKKMSVFSFLSSNRNVQWVLKEIEHL